MGVMLSRLGYKAALTSNCDEAFRHLLRQRTLRRGPDRDEIHAPVARWWRKFIEDLLQKNPRQHYAFVTGSPVLRKPFTLQDLDDFMGAFRRPQAAAFSRATPVDKAECKLLLSSL